MTHIIQYNNYGLVCESSEDIVSERRKSPFSTTPVSLAVGDRRKFDRGLTSLLHDELYWLDVPERVTYKMGVMAVS